MRKWYNGNWTKRKAASDTATALLSGLQTLVIERVHENAIIPQYASEGDSGMDIFATKNMVIYPDFRGILGSGLKIEIPRHPLHDIGYRFECQVRPRSGISTNTYIKVILGTIDNFYRGEIGIIISNTADKVSELTRVDYVLDLEGNKVALVDANIYAESVPVNTYFMRRGDRIAQLVFNEIIRPLKVKEGVVSTEGSRGGGVGHSGI